MSQIQDPNTNSILLRALMERQRKKDALEEKLKGWTEYPSETEKEKIQRSVRMVKEAVEEYIKLSSVPTEVILKGSYKNNTNIPSESDVDLGVVATTYHLNDCPPGTSDADYNFVPTSFKYEDFKELIAAALIAKFGVENISVEEKAIKIRASSARVDADVTPHFVRWKFKQPHNREDRHEGVAIKTPTTIIANWPKQDYDNGVTKHGNTDSEFKKIVRILKTMRTEMEANGYSSPAKAKSFLIYCLCYNVPDANYGTGSFTQTLENILNYLKTELTHKQNTSYWLEVNKIKQLFGSHQPWTEADALAFVSDALNYLGELKK